MLSDSSFRKTSKCSFYRNFLAKKEIPIFPIQRVSPEFLNSAELIHATGFNKPFVITSGSEDKASDRLHPQKESSIGIVLPSRDKDLTYVSEVVGPAHPVKIIEVGQQSEISDWTLGEYAQYLKNYRAEDHKILNMITLEFSATPFNAKVQAPTFVRDLDWIDTIWPIDRRARGDYPKVQKYCLAGMAGSYTDFHIDFGGTSVWYHVLKGQKRFYLVPPTTSNLKAFERWTCSSAQSDVFFGDLLDPPNQCYQFDLNPGETFIIPSGWIHAVFTPLDSLVFGGNFVHSYAIVRQLQIYSIEHRTRVQKAYRFPFFRQINWYFLCTLLPLALAQFVNVEPKNTPSWVDDMMSDDDEDADDLQAMCNGLKDSIVLYQLPYLVKICEIWHKSDGEGQEKGVFSADSLKETECTSVEEVLSKWWQVLFAIAQQLPAKPSSNGESDMADAKEKAVAHIHHIQNMITLDLLDDAVVRPVFGAFERDLFRLLPVAVSTTPSAEAVISVPESGEATQPLTFKFSLKRAPPVPLVSPNALSMPSADSQFSGKVIEEPKKGPVQKITFTQTASPETATPAAPSVPAASRKVVSLKLTLGSDSSAVPKPSTTAVSAVSTSTASASRTVKSILSRAASSMPVRLASSTEAADVRSTGSRKYGTRGLKLSKDFLNRAMDVDIGDEPDEAQQDDVEEEEYAEPSQRFSAAREATTFNSAAANPSDFTFRDREDEREGGEEWRRGADTEGDDGAEQGNRRASTAGTYLDSDEEDSDHALGSDAEEEDFSDEDGFIVGGSGKKGGKKRKLGQRSEPLPKKVNTPAAASIKPQYFVDRLSESSERNARSNAAAIAQQQQLAALQRGASVPQIQGVRINTGPGKKSTPANNRLKIMKKLGLK